MCLLQAPPPGKLSPERDDFDPEQKPQGTNVEMVGSYVKICGNNLEKLFWLDSKVSSAIVRHQK